MNKNIYKHLLILCLLFFLLTSIQASLQTGNLKGQVFDEEGTPVEKAIVYLNSSEVSSLLFSITPESGKFRFFSLPSGIYTAIVEIPDFKRTILPDLIIQAGKTVKVDIPLKKIVSEEGEEEIIAFSSPTLDSISAENISSIEKKALKKFPLKRDMTHAAEALPGVSKDTDVIPKKTYVIHGSPASANVYALDSLILNNPKDTSLPVSISPDFIEEISLDSTGHSIAKSNYAGGVINLISKSYEEKVNLEIIAHHTSDTYNSDLRETENIESMGLALPPLDKHLWDISFSLGGPIYYNKIWIFTSTRLNFFKQNTPFFPWTDPFENLHRSYDRNDRDFYTALKISTNLIPSLNASLSFNYIDLFQDYNSLEYDWNLTAESTHILDHQKSYILNGLVDYKLNENTSVSGQGGYVHTETPLSVQPESLESPRYLDSLTGYRWGSALLNDQYTGKRFQIHALLSHYLTNLSKVDMEIQAGISYQYLSDERISWTENPLQYHFFNGSPYFYGLTNSPQSGNPVGTGRISLSQARRAPNSQLPVSVAAQYGIFFQNSFTFAKRISLNLGLRFDRSVGSMELYELSASNDPLSLKIGEKSIQPLIDSNPFAAVVFPSWKNAIIWNTFSPQAALSIDIFGNNKTLLKASFGRYKDPMLLTYLHALNPYNPDKLLSFIWYDENQDGLAGENDSYALYPNDYRIFLEDYYRKSVNPDLKPSYSDELSLSLQHELFPNFSLRFTYIHKSMGNIIENALYDPESDQTWYSVDSTPEEWWEEFNTIVPGIDGYSDISVPAYFPSEEAPLMFFRLDNVPELKRKYEALEITIEKRMASKWQFLGSLVLSRSTGHIGLGYDSISGMTPLADSPNAFVNISGNARLDLDRPVVLKMMGAYELPWNMLLSFYYLYSSGTPWARQVTVIPPGTWTDQMNVIGTEALIYLEEPGDRRYPAVNSLDIRFEKTFQLKGNGRLSACFDFFNLLGDKTDNILKNDGGYWYPAEENSTEGVRIIHPFYNQIVSLTGFQGFRFTFRLSF